MNKRWLLLSCFVIFLTLNLVPPAAAAPRHGRAAPSSLADRRLEWPAREQWRRVVFLQDYNTRIVIFGTTLLGCAGGLVGSFTLLRKRALMGDALSHATLPGIALAFIIATKLGMDGKSLGVLLCGATLTGLLGIALILLIRNLTRLKEDTALCAVLSVFFGAGVALLGIVQQFQEGHAAGLESFIYGKTASMGIADTQLIAGAAAICIVTCLALFKELKLLCFDDIFASSRGFPVTILDITLMALVVIVTIVGLQAVGLILMIALLVIPAAAARFWTESLWKMFVTSGSLGALGGCVGSGLSALFSKLPSGAMIVLVCTAFFVISLVFGSSRGLLARYQRRWSLNRSVDRQHLLRAIYEITERRRRPGDRSVKVKEPISVEELLPKRSWSRLRLYREIHRSQREEYIECVGDEIRLTKRGLIEAARLTRQHRLWELYLITHADIAPGRVDRDADAIEHVLEPEIVAELEEILKRENAAIPESPHSLESTAATPITEHSELGGA